MSLNRVGRRAKYKYTMDDGTVIKLRLDATYGDLAACGLSPVTTADNAGNKPSNFKPRVVFWIPNDDVPNGEGEAATPRSNLRREFVCAADSTAFTSKDQVSITVDGIAGQTTGRRGEQISF